MCSTIQFTFTLDQGQLNVLLEAEIIPCPHGFYIAKSFHVPGHRQTAILPEITIKKVDGHWVHKDSGWQTTLSEAVGQAIEKFVEKSASFTSPPEK